VAIRVLIEREIEAGQEVKLLQFLMRMRSKAMQAKGYISGETLRALDDPNRFLVISTWNSMEDWKAWEKSPEREKLKEEMKQFLRSPERSVGFTYL
jgi:heme-degrading monooxygenase HmoA